MSGLFYDLGRTLGYAAIPAIRTSKSVWHSLAGTEAASIRAETEFGQAMASELRLQVGVSTDAEDQSLVRGIGQRLATRVRNKHRTFRVEVMREGNPVAVGLPGGFVFVSTPLLDLAQHDPDELAFVIGHEMGHIVRGHALERLSNRLALEGVSTVLSRGLLNPWMRNSDLRWLETAYGTEAESEADEFGVRIATAAGWDRRAVIRFLERLSRRRRESEGGEYLRSHPAEEERLKSLKSLLPRSSGPVQA
jgi:predicted Zn-dependent protease